MKYSDLKLGSKVEIKDSDGKISKGYVYKLWEEDEYHQAGGIILINTKYGMDNYVEFKADEVGKWIFKIPK